MNDVKGKILESLHTRWVFKEPNIEGNTFGRIKPFELVFALSEENHKHERPMVLVISSVGVGWVLSRLFRQAKV